MSFTYEQLRESINKGDVNIAQQILTSFNADEYLRQYWVLMHKGTKTAISLKVNLKL